MWSSRADSWSVEGCECKRNAEAKTKSFSTTHNQRFPLFLKYWPFPASWIYFFIFNGTLKGGFSGFLSQDYQITIDKFYNGNWWWEAGNKKEDYARFYYTLLEKNLTPSENRLTAILNWKSPSPTRDSNPASPDRMPSLYHFYHHHFQCFLPLKRKKPCSTQPP